MLQWYYGINCNKPQGSVRESSAKNTLGNTKTATTTTKKQRTTTTTTTKTKKYERTPITIPIIIMSWTTTATIVLLILLLIKIFLSIKSLKKKKQNTTKITNKNDSTFDDNKTPQEDIKIKVQIPFVNISSIIKTPVTAISNQAD